MSEDTLAVIDGQSINIATLEQGVSAAISRLVRGQGFTFFTLNLDHIVKRRQHPSFRAAYASATFVTADGAPIAALGRKQHGGIERTTGADLVVPLARQAARAGIPIGFFGSNAQTLGTCLLKLQGMAPRLRVAAWEAPPQGFDPASPAAEAAITRLVSAGAKIIFLALGAPKQELLAHRMQSLFPEVGFVCIGAALDFIAKTQDRAPAFFQESGLEWAWRLVSNPRRMGKRYALCALAFLSLLRNPRGEAEPVKAFSLGSHPVH